MCLIHPAWSQENPGFSFNSALLLLLLSLHGTESPGWSLVLEENFQGRAGID